MEDLSKKTCMIVDQGLFSELAIRLARDFGRVFYYVPNEDAFVKSTKDYIGDGIEEIIRIKTDENFWTLVDSKEIDIFVFPDVYSSGLQVHLASLGCLVFGMRKAEYLELNRWRSRQTQHKAGLPCPYTEQLFGIDALKKTLEKTDDAWVKISYYRGDTETYHHIKKTMSGEFFDRLGIDLGYSKDFYEFIIEHTLEGVEIGYDGWTVDGLYPDQSLFGYEAKGLGYIGEVTKYEDIPAVLTLINSHLSTIFREEGSRGFFSTEVRIGKDRIPYLTDPCIRMGSPPSEAHIEMVSNLGEVIWEAANGRLVSPKFSTKYAAIVRIDSQWADQNWMKILYPHDQRRWIKFRNFMQIDDEICIIPQKTGKICNVGSIVGLGDTMKEAIDKCKELASEVKGYDLMIETSCLDKVQETIKEGTEYGINF